MLKPPRGVKPPRTPKSTRKNTSRQTDPVQVYCRIRPLENRHGESCVKVLDTRVLQLTSPEFSHAMKHGGAVKETQYTFQHIFDEYTSQKAIYDHAALPLVEDVLHGKNALLFAYGVTCSGKTYTMAGHPQDQGILPRCLDVMFNSIGHLQARKYVFTPDRMNKFDVNSEVDAMAERQRKEVMPRMLGNGTPRTPVASRYGNNFDYNSKLPRIRDQSKVEDVEDDNNYSVFVSYCEIYNNYIYDLLEDTPYDPIVSNKPPQSKNLREDTDHQMYVNNIIEVEVKSTEEAYEVLQKGQKRRKIAHTALNSESSRSHSVFNIRLVQAPLDPIGEEVLQDKGKVVISQLALVDLAGSERCARTGNTGEKLKEAGNINASLMTLRSCIEALRENQQDGANVRMVPYRDSKLTNLFKNYFEGEGKVRMVVCVNPKSDDYDETVHVMRFAELTQEVQVARSENIHFDNGLAKGRRRINQQYKEAAAKVHSEGGDVLDVPVPLPLVYSLGTCFPTLELRSIADDITLRTLTKFLEERESTRGTLLVDINHKYESFRERLVDMEKENISLKQRVRDLETQLGSRKREVVSMEKKVNTLFRDNHMLQKTTTQYEQDRRDLEREIGDREWRIQQELTEKNRLKHDFQAKLVLNEHNFNRAVEKTKRQAKEDAISHIRSQKKLDKLKYILNTGSTGGDSDSTGSSIITPVTPRMPRPTPRTTTTFNSPGGRIYPAKSEPDLTSETATYRSSAHQRAQTQHVPLTPRAQTQHAPITRATNRVPRSRSPPPVKPKPVLNPRHRRSKSAHEVWVNHQPKGTVPTGTILQPKLRKKRSVTKLTEKDTRNANKYMLTHQDVDSEGDIATKLVKGDVLTTAGGGTAVIFNDVETLKQTSPGSKKRRSPALRPEDFEGDWTDTETRCHIGHEGHPIGNKRNKISHV